MRASGELPRSLTDLGRAYRERTLSPVEVVETLLTRIEAGDKVLNAFIVVTGERALEEAENAEREILAGRYRGPLHGIPVGLKDLIYTEGVRTTMGSAFFEDFVPDYSATVATRLLEAGSILLGKTNTHEFAYGPTGDRSRFGPTRNPHDAARISGGSSGGSAAAVAADLIYASLGSDTGGSVRIPAALCGIVGMKPTFGRVSKKGVFPLSWTLDHVGPLTRTVEDNALVLNSLAGHDPGDPYSAKRPAEDFARDLRRGVRGGVIGVPRDFYFEHVGREVAERLGEVIEVFRSSGAGMREVEIPHLWETLKAQRLTLAADAYAVHEERLRSEPERFDAEVRERLMDGERLKAYRYANAQQRKLGANDEFGRALEGVDVLLTPTVPITATLVDQREVDIEGYEESVRSAVTRLTGPTNLTGFPSLSIPCGSTASGLPVGVQLIGRTFDEATLYRFAHAYEMAAAADLTG
ncbi:MAG: glutamyl-tRNA amidotransferase [Rubrobacteraceae bacterium]|nr:glutamyl-tRNA amidotransferase [Rubrobacteraceae bacterium]